LLTAAPAALFSPSLFHYFYADDFTFFVRINNAAAAWPLTPLTQEAYLSRPLLDLLFAGEFHLFGNNYFLWHAAGILFHLCATWALFKTLSLVSPKKIAVFCALLFSLLLFNSQAVFWCNINGYILFFFLVLLSFYCLVRYRAGENPRHLYAAAGCLLPACFLYEHGVFVCAVWFAGLWLTGRANGKKPDKKLWLLLLPVAAGVFYFTLKLPSLQAVTASAIGSKLWAAPLRPLSYSLFLTLWLFLGFFFPSLAIWQIPYKTSRLLVAFDPGRIYSLPFALNALLLGILLAGFIFSISKKRLRKNFLVLILSLASAATYIFLIGLGRSLTHNLSYLLGCNAYYSYIFTGYLLLAAACAFDPEKYKTEFSPALRKIVGGAAIGFVLTHAVFTHRLIDYVKDDSRFFRAYTAYIDAFAARHKSEPDFSFKVKNDVVIHFTGKTRLSQIFYAGFTGKQKPKYVIDLHRTRFYKRYRAGQKHISLSNRLLYDIY